jgi:hypothetical protein
VRHGLCAVDVDGLDKECLSKAGRAHTWELGPLVLFGKEHGHEEPLLPAVAEAFVTHTLGRDERADKAPSIQDDVSSVVFDRL